MTPLSEIVCIASIWLFMALLVLFIYYEMDKWLGIRITQARSRAIAKTMLHCKFDAPGSSDAFCGGCTEKSCVNWSPTRKRR